MGKFETPDLLGVNDPLGTLPAARTRLAKRDTYVLSISGDLNPTQGHPPKSCDGTQSTYVFLLRARKAKIPRTAACNSG